MKDVSEEKNKKEELKTVEGLQQELRYAHDELSRTNSELMQLTLNLDGLVEERTAELMQSREKLLQINRLLLSVRTISQAIVAEKNKDELLKQVCEILVEVTGYAFCVIAVCSEDGKSLIPTAYWGFFDDESVLIKLGEECDIYCPVKEALPESRSSVVNSIKKNGQYKSWQKSMMESGFRSFITFPMINKKRVYGYLSVYSNQDDYFKNDKEIELLETVANDIGLALYNYAMDEERKKTEEELLRSEAKYRELLESINDVLFSMNIDGSIEYISPAIERIAKTSSEDFLGEGYKRFIHPDDLEHLLENIKYTFPGERNSIDFRLVRMDGEVRHIRTSIWIKEADGLAKVFTGIMTDITDRRRAEEELYERDELLQNIINTSPTCIFVKDREGRYVLVNTTLESLYGCKPGEMSGKTDRDLIDVSAFNTKDIERFIKDDLVIIEQQKMKFIVEDKFTMSDGGVIWFQTTKIPLAIKGKSDYMLGISVDISKRKEAENELREVLQTSSDIVTYISSGIFIYQYTPEKKLVLLDGNPAASQLTGINIEKYRGKEFDEIWPEARKVGLTQECLKTMETGEPFNTEDLYYKDRRFEGFFKIVAFPIPGQKLCMALENVTGRKQAEKALRESGERLRNFFDNSRDIIYFSNIDGKVQEINKVAEEISGFSRDEIIGSNINEATPDKEERKRFVKIIEEKGYVRDFEITYKIKDGSTRYCLETATALYDSDGNVVGHQGIIRDITERKSAEQQLMQAEKLSSLGGILSGVAHELNNPLTSIIGNAQLLMRKDIPPDLKKKLEVIEKESVRSSKIVAGLLSFAREHKPEKKMIQINEVILEAYNLREYELRVDNIPIDLDLTEELPSTYADPYQLQQVCINMINNAHDALQEKGSGTLNIRSYKEDDNVVIDFEDNGPGISEENIKKIFDPFFTTKEVGKGTGLGLSIIYGIITEHGGSVDVETRMGKGTKFIITLPIVNEEIRVEEEEYRRTKKPTREVNVLIVEDEESLRNYVREVLEAEGYDVETARNGEEAIDLLGKGDFEVVITDMKMPGLSGQNIYHYIQKNNSLLAEKIIFITGDVLGEETQGFLKMTGLPFIEKPFTIEQLLENLSKLLTEGKYSN